MQSHEGLNGNAIKTNLEGIGEGLQEFADYINDGEIETLAEYVKQVAGPILALTGKGGGGGGTGATGGLAAGVAQTDDAGRDPTPGIDLFRRSLIEAKKRRMLADPNTRMRDRDGRVTQEGNLGQGSIDLTRGIEPGGGRMNGAALNGASREIAAGQRQGGGNIVAPTDNSNNSTNVTNVSNGGGGGPPPSPRRSQHRGGMYDRANF